MSNLTKFQKITLDFPTKFKIGDKVVSKKTGLPNIGLIVATEHASFYIQKLNGYEPAYWTELFPEWQLKYIYTLCLEKPVKYLSVEEFEMHKANGGLLQYNSYDDLESVHFIQYCEDDLELFE